MTSGLFREEALAHQEERQWGECVDLQPLGVRLLGTVLVGMVAACGCFLAAGDYQRKAAVSGVLVADKGAVQIRAPTDGIVEELSVGQGEGVGKGESLLLIRPGLAMLDGKATGRQMQAQNSRQQALLEQQIRDEKAAFPARLSRLQTERRGLEHQRQQLGALAGNETAVGNLLKARYERMAALGEKRLVAAGDLDEIRVEWLKQENVIRQVSLELANNQQALEESTIREELLRLEHRQRLAGLEADLAELHKQQLRLSAEQSMHIVSPVSGTVAVLARRQGQSVMSQDVLLSVIPERSRLEAELHVPSRAAGFITPGMPVNIRFDAFPYQKFGMQRARVLEISRSVLAPREAGDPRGSEPVYRVRAAIEKQSVEAFGQQVFLKPGMQFSADIVLERRSLLEWLMEPLLVRGGRG